MILKQDLSGYEDRGIKDQKNQEWEYISELQMQDLYPNGGFKILADLKKSDNESSIGTLIFEEKEIQIFGYQPKLKYSQRCLGYLRIENHGDVDSYIRVVGNRKKRGSYYFLFTVLVLLLIGLGYLFMMNRENNNINLDKEAISYHVEGMQNNDPNNISIPIFSEFKGKVGDSEMKYHLANPIGNPCYFKYYIVLVDKEKEEELYQSDLIEPGTAIPGFKLKRKLDVGTYQAIVRVKTYDLKNPKTEMNGGEVNITINIGEDD